MADAPTPYGSNEETIAGETIREFWELVPPRNAFAVQWEEVASLILPSHRNTFQYGARNTQGAKRTDRQVDATGQLCLSRFVAIADSLLTPGNSYWQGFAPEEDALLKDRDTMLYFEQVQRIIFTERYKPTSGFQAAIQGCWQSTGAFGNHAIRPDLLVSPTGEKGLRYQAVPIGEVYIKRNFQGIPVGFIRYFRLKAYQAAGMFGGRDKLPERLKTAFDKGSEVEFDFLHRVCPRDFYDPARYDAKGMPYASYYVAMDDKWLMAPEGGFNTFPLPYGSYDISPGEVYGRGPAMFCLPALKSLNAIKRIFLKQGHRAADPVLLVANGLIDLNLMPGAPNTGGMTERGERLVDVLPTGNHQITIEMMQEESNLIKDNFLVSLFQILEQTPEMSATEVIERTKEKATLLGPTLGRQTEFLGQMTEREVDLSAQLGRLPPMPPALREAGGRFKVVPTSPLYRMMEAGDVAGFMRTLENVRELIAVTQDMTLLHPFAFDRAIPDIARVQHVRPSWMASPKEIKTKGKQHAQQVATQQQIQAMPAQAAMMKAQAVQQKAQAPQ